MGALVAAIDVGCTDEASDVILRMEACRDDKRPPAAEAER
jgi:hypothetical protein